ncbi:MAG: VWA domain-containing protein [Pseudomonadota bacterium]
MTLAYPWLLLLLPLPVAVWRLMPPYRTRVQAIRVPFFRDITQAAGLSPQDGASVLGRHPLQWAAALVIWLMMVLALAGPERIGPPITVESAARDIVIALDISGSMDARDFVDAEGARLQRLAAVKAVIGDFISARDSDRIALIVFGSKAFVQAPFTEDLDSLAGFLDQIQVGMAGPNTALGDAIGLSVRTFEASDVDERLLILLSDGADTGSRMPPINAADIAAQRDVTIFTIGVGDPNGDGDGRVDLDILDRIASETGGRNYFASDQAALTEIYAEIDTLTPRKVETLSFRPKQDLTYLPLCLALVVLIVTTSILSVRRGRPA